MITWWVSLSWPYALLVLLLVAVVIGFIWLWRATRPRPQATPVRRRAPHVVDYSAATQKQIAWLGDRYLCAKPVNRRAAPWPMEQVQS